MNAAATTVSPTAHASRPHLDQKAGPVTALIFIGLLAVGLFFSGFSLVHDISDAGAIAISWLPYILLGVALLIALGFEFVNGFHDTANAVATVIYTHSLPPNFAVLWSGLFNFLGVLVSSGAVAFGIISLLPVELILQVGTSGVDWAQATKVGYSLLLSPLVGFVFSALLLLVLRTFVKNQALYKEPKGKTPPPWWIRGLLVLTCTGVSFAHGSNDGQKGMGLIMLILVGTVPMAYALNRAMPVSHMTEFVAVAQVTQEALVKDALQAAPADSRAALSEYVRTKQLDDSVVPALAQVVASIGAQVREHGSLARMPIESVGNVRNDMYLASEAIRFLDKNKDVKFSADSKADLKAFKKQIDNATKFIPLWVKVAVAIALGLGTMVGWKRIVVTVGEKIGKSHLTYGQGASAELVAMCTIGAADAFGLPVSTTHVLSSGVAGTMAANRSGLQWSTIRNLAMAWVLTLPAAIVLSGSLYWLFAHVF